jgi:hypothetical protein
VYDDDGRLVRTIVRREPRVSDEDRAQMLALELYERSLCPCGCGQPLEEATDPKRAFRVQDFRCRARSALEKHERNVRANAEATNKPEGWDDGLGFYIDDSFVPDG